MSCGWFFVSVFGDMQEKVSQDVEQIVLNDSTFNLHFKELGSNIGQNTDYHDRRFS
jgi:hypothetical protein